MAHDPKLPYAPPNLDYTAARFRIISQQASARTRGGSVQALGFGPSFWDISITTGPLTPDEHGNMEAWFDDFRGALRYANIFDPKRRYPRAYPNGFGSMVKAGVGGTFTGLDIDVTAVSAYTITLGQLPANFSFRRGDMIMLSEGTRRALHRITEDIQASGAGGVILPVMPEVRTTLFGALAIGVIVEPYCVCEAVSFDGDASGDMNPVTMRFREVVR